MIYSRSKSQISHDDDNLEKASNQLAIDFFTEQGLKALLIDNGQFRREKSRCTPDLLLKFQSTRMVCEVKTLGTSGQHKELEALTHELEKRIIKLQGNFYYEIWFDSDVALNTVNLNDLISEFKKILSDVDTLPYEFGFQEKVKIILTGRTKGNSELTCFNLGTGINKNHKNIRDIISRADKQLRGRFNFNIPKLCLIINRRTKQIESSFRSACMGDTKFSITDESLINSGNAAHTPGSNQSISAVILLSPNVQKEPLLFHNPYAKTPLPLPLLLKWHPWLINP